MQNSIGQSTQRDESAFNEAAASQTGELKVYGGKRTIGAGGVM